jgi:DNA-binding NarL/FixJ family response regulator
MSIQEAELVGSAMSGEEMLRVVADARPDVILLDLMLPEGPSSPELVQRLRELVPGVRIVLLSSMPEDTLSTEAERIGADAHSTKVLTVDGLLTVITGA